MDRITFDFENNQIEFDTETQKSVEVDLCLKEKKADILKAAGMNQIDMQEFRDAVNEAFKELGIFANPFGDGFNSIKGEFTKAGFPEEMIRLAYDITFNRLSKYSRPYMLVVLRNLHSEGIYTRKQYLEKQNKEQE